MEPVLRPGDWLLVWRGVGRGHPAGIQPGQIVIARHPADPGLFLVKRAVRRLPDGWWLGSDNQAAGAVDSRSFGPVPTELIEGRLLVRYWRSARADSGRGRLGAS